MNNKKLLTLYFLGIFLCILFLSSCNVHGDDDVQEVTLSDSGVTITIGVSSFHDFAFGQLDFLSNDIRERLGVDVVFIELGTGRMDVDEYIQAISFALETNAIDMIVGVPSYLAFTWIENNKLMDITDYLESPENIHQGVIYLSKRMGGGRMYFISPVINEISLLFTNLSLLDELGLGHTVPDYVSWGDLLNMLEKSQDAIDVKGYDYFPIAFSTGNARHENVYLATRFLMESVVLSSNLFQGSQLTAPTKELFGLYAEIATRFGKSHEELRNGILPRNLIFAEGNFVYMVGNTWDLELLLNQEFNDYFNSEIAFTDEERVIVNLPALGVSVINFDGTRKQNLREFSIFINANTEHKDEAIKILNIFMSKEYAHRAIENRMITSLFSSSRFTFPSYFDDETIAQLNEFYSGQFDVSLFYNVEFGNIITGMYIFDWGIIESLDKGFVYVRENYSPGLDIGEIIVDAILILESNLLEHNSKD